MARNTSNSDFNRRVHESDVDAESSLRAQHAALAKMAEAPQPLQPPAPVASTPSVTPLAAPSVAQSPHMAHPAFHGLINALRKPRASNTVRVVMPKKI
jgi:hypothetical protein